MTAATVDDVAVATPAMHRAVSVCRRCAWIWMCLVGVALASAYLMLPGDLAKPLTLAFASFAAAGVTAAAVRRHMPARRLPWVLLAGFQLIWGGCWAAWAVHAAFVGPVGPGSLVNTAFLPAYPMLIAVLGWKSVARERGRFVAAQSVILSLALFDGGWALLLHRYFDGAGVLGLAQLNPLCYAFTHLPRSGPRRPVSGTGRDRKRRSPPPREGVDRRLVLCDTLSTV